jgi:glycosyltransferase involved in cell wall biosynthesis
MLAPSPPPGGSGPGSDRPNRPAVLSVPAAAPPRVSVLTPVYDGAAYLAECIESVLAQTFRDFEYVVVDNASTDGSLAVAESYARKDERVRVVHHDRHLPVVASWNRALGAVSSHSDYLKMVCADDWLFPECLERMVALMEAHPSVGLVSAYRLDDRHVNLDGLPHPSTVVPGRELGRRSMTTGPYVFGSPTSVLFRGRFFRSAPAFFNDASLHPDVEACYAILRESDFGFVHQVLSFTRRHDETVTSRLARRLNSYLLGQIEVVLRHGRAFLDEEEYALVLARRLRRHRRFLLKSLLRRRDPAFWDFHERGLDRLGLKSGLARIGGRAARLLRGTEAAARAG